MTMPPLAESANFVVSITAKSIETAGFDVGCTHLGSLVRDLDPQEVHAESSRHRDPRLALSAPDFDEQKIKKIL